MQSELLTAASTCLVHPSKKHGQIGIKPCCVQQRLSAVYVLSADVLFLQMATGFKKVRKYFDMFDLNGDRLIDMGEFTSQVSTSPVWSRLFGGSTGHV